MDSRAFHDGRANVIQFVIFAFRSIKLFQNSSLLLFTLCRVATATNHYFISHTGTGVGPKARNQFILQMVEATLLQINLDVEFNCVIKAYTNTYDTCTRSGLAIIQKNARSLKRKRNVIISTTGINESREYRILSFALSNFQELPSINFHFIERPIIKSPYKYPLHVQICICNDQSNNNLHFSILNNR